MIVRQVQLVISTHPAVDGPARRKLLRAHFLGLVAVAAR
jgi:hypothetical protein